MVDSLSQFLSELLGFAFTRLILVGTTLVTMWLFWYGHYLPAIGFSLALAYFFYLYWQYVQISDIRQE